MTTGFGFARLAKGFAAIFEIAESHFGMCLTEIQNLVVKSFDGFLVFSEENCRFFK